MNQQAPSRGTTIHRADFTQPGRALFSGAAGANVDFTLFLLITFRFLAQLNHTYKVIPHDLKILHVMSMAILFALVLTTLVLLIKNVSLELNRYKIVLLFVSYVWLIALFNSRLNTPTLVDALSYFLILFFVVTFARISISYRYLRYFVIMFLAILVVQLVYSFQQHGLLFFNMRDYRGTIGSFFGHANSASFFIATLLFLFHYTVGRRAAIFKTVLFILLLLLGTRSVILVTCTLLGGLKIGEYFKDSSTLLLLSFIALSVAIALYISYVVSEAWSTSPALISGNSLKWRVRHWLLYTDRITTVFQLFFGKGLASHEAVPLFFYDRFFEVHNDFLKITYDMGLVGLALFLWADISILRRFLDRIDDTRHRNCLTAIFLAKMFFMFFDNLVTNFCGTMVYYFIVSNFQDIINEIDQRGGRRPEPPAGRLGAARQNGQQETP